MRAGQLRHRVWADEPVAGQDDSGAETIDWQPRGELPCAIEPVGGREALQAGQIVADMDTRITTRWSPLAAQVSAKWRLRFVRRSGGAEVETVFDVVRPPAEKNLAIREIEFMCRSGLNQG